MLCSTSSRLTSRPFRHQAGPAQSHTRLCAEFLEAGPRDVAPDYTATDKQPLNRLTMHLFRTKMVAHLGTDSQYQGCGALSAVAVFKVSLLQSCFSLKAPTMQV